MFAYDLIKVSNTELWIPVTLNLIHKKVATIRQLHSRVNNTKCLAVVCTSGPQTGVQHS